MAGLESLLEEYKLKGYDLVYLRPVKSGKEATVHVVSCGDRKLALKVYIAPEFRAFQDIRIYFEGRFFRKPSIRKAIRKRSRFGKRFLHGSWVRREFFLLAKLAKAGADIPEVLDWTPTSVLMQFVGERLDPAPRLIDVRLAPDEAKNLLETLLKNVELFLETGIVHGDLSAYNVLWWNHKPFIIDFPQAVDLRCNPHRGELLKRDLDYLVAYFGRFITVDPAEIHSRFHVS